MDKNSLPKTLQEAVIYFANYQNCHDFMVSLRWPDGVVRCPHCGSDNVKYLPNARVFKCFEKHPLAKFSLKVGTIFEDSPIGLDKWIVAMWLVVNCRNGVSSYEIARDLKVTQKTAWFMDHRIRFALHQGSFEKIGGEGTEVEADETYIGGLARNMHKNVRARKIQGRTGYAGKTAVFGLLDRGKNGKSRIKAQVMPNTWSQKEARAIIRETVEQGTTVYTDEHGAYHALGSEGFNHAFVRHAEFYVDGAVHTNGIENFWSLLKRGIKGTYVSVEPFHMFRYLDEQAFRFNERFCNDQERFLAAMQGTVDKRLTYKLLTGKQEDASSVSIE